jgi:hypothetical protein
MSLRHLASILTFRVAPLLVALCIPIAGAVAEDSKYPDLKGQWNRTFVPRWTTGEEKAPLTAEYQKVYEANLADMANGGPGNVPSWYCLPQGMPMMMNAYDPMEVVVTPETTYILISHVNDSYRRIYTDRTAHLRRPGHSVPRGQSGRHQGADLSRQSRQGSASRRHHVLRSCVDAAMDQESNL